MKMNLDHFYWCDSPLLGNLKINTLLPEYQKNSSNHCSFPNSLFKYLDHIHHQNSSRINNKLMNLPRRRKNPNNLVREH